jgi:hypothetical protein
MSGWCPELVKGNHEPVESCLRQLLRLLSAFDKLKSQLKLRSRQRFLVYSFLEITLGDFYKRIDQKDNFQTKVWTPNSGFRSPNFSLDEMVHFFLEITLLYCTRA